MSAYDGTINENLIPVDYYKMLEENLLDPIEHYWNMPVRVDDLLYGFGEEDFSGEY